MAIRNITKSLITIQDIAQGVGAVSQTRGGSVLALDAVDVPYAVATVAEMVALDISLYTRCRVYSDTLTYVDYIYDPLDVTGIAPAIGAGTWRSTTTGGAKTVLSAGQTTVTPVGAYGKLEISGPDADSGTLVIGVDYTITDDTTVELTDSYPAGTYLLQS